MRKHNLLFVLLLTAAVLTQTAAVYAKPAQEAVKTLTVKEAVNMAVQNSTELKNLSENMYLNDKSRANLAASFDDPDTTWQQTISNSIAIMQNDMRQSAYMNNQTQMKQSMEISITRYFASILAAERELTLYDINLSLSEKNLEIARVKSELGMVSKASYETQRMNYEKEADSRKSKEMAIDDAYRALNAVLGMADDARYELVLETKYVPLRERDLDRHIRTCISDNNNIKSKENDVKAAEIKLASSVEQTSVEERQVALEQAKRSFEDQKASLEEKILSCYNDIKNLQLQYEANQIELEKMNKELEIKKTQFELGKLTQIELETYEYRVLQLNYTILGQINNHCVLVMQFENPNLL